MTCFNGGYYDCQDFGGYLYRGKNGDECVSAEECLKKGGHPYYDSGKCLEVKPAENGNFIERSDGIY